MSPSEETEIAASLRREHTADEWIADEAVAEWIDSVGGVKHHRRRALRSG